ncbi:filamentous hemagglutinin family N-terminal domain protein [Rivularia sp. PCC 7116]|uniref:two-partner secretion domain-containing protein n=1 Tax=Rivularia sp. PCC 7116 TaxID=373994 RepID=UPI00029EDF80|nr:filamentous hemagglutinin N-terminal domain-containing protein [Rivularia sp. PCC 7116]AFY54832.1 filamentous hemagglutinin family N-terminal domain protein [Rivularia sp. PCC 7116]
MKGIAFLSGFITVFLTSGIILPASSQVTSDNTTNTTVDTSNNNFNILNGIQKGNNLFHSFKEFSIPTGSSATFDNSTDVVNIINRVTGGNTSNINGLIKANGNANLFLINPAGIVFGENARLNIGGSFFGSTAESILFEDGFEFSAVNRTDAPLLTVSVPVGLQMGTNSGEIQVQSTGHNLSFSPNGFFPPFTREANPQALSVKPGKTIALVGGGITSTGGQIVAEGGRIELGSVSDGEVKLNSISTGFALDYSNVSNFQDIQLAQKASLDASESDINGGIHLSGRRINVTDGSVGLVQNSKAGIKGGNITVNASELLEFTGTTTDGKIRSNFTTETINTGASGEIRVSTKDLIFTDGGQIVTRTYSGGNSGNVTIDASESVQVIGSAALNPRFLSSIFLTVNGRTSTGKAGDLNISTKDFIASDGGLISTASYGKGDGGNITLNADNIDLSSTDPVFDGSTDLRVGSFRGGDGGSLTINTQRLTVRDGARINATTIGEGNAGSVTINASKIVDVRNGTITSSATSPDLRTVLNGFDTDSTGKAGSININTNRFIVRDESTISVANNGPTDAGELSINANSLFVDNQAILSANTKLGEGGNIALNLKESLILRNNSLIDTEAGGTGNGGNITIYSPIIAGFENSDIVANALEGNGGNIDITTQGIFGLKFRDSLTEENDISASSQFGVNGTVAINNISIDPSSGLTELPVKLADSSQKIASGCAAKTGNTFVATGRGGIPQNPNEQVDTSNTWSDIRDLSAYRKPNNNSENTSISKKPAIIEATGFIRNRNGEIELVALQNTPFNKQQASNCSGINT